MFYSHEILTSRRHGVATVWLVATLGSKSSQRKVTRKEILKVNVPKVCESVMEPEVPMALRLQSSLLYGISRVYSQQCGYVLIDAHSAQNALRQIALHLKAKTLDVDVSRQRPEQLVLQDDPSFDLDLVLGPLDLNLSSLELSTNPSQQSFFSPQTAFSSQPSVQPLGEIIIPSPGTHVSHDFRQSDSVLDAFDRFQDDDMGLLPEIDFTIDADGNLLALEESSPGRNDQAQANATGRHFVRRDSSILEQVLREHRDAHQGLAGQDVLTPTLRQRCYTDDHQTLQPLAALDIDPFNAVQTDRSLLDVEPFPLGIRAGPRADGTQGGGDTENGIVTAPQRHARARFPKVDNATQLSTRILASWRNDYVSNMAEALKTKAQHRAPWIARANVASWTWSGGIGNIGTNMASMHSRHLLDSFCGDALVQSITGRSFLDGTRKRNRVQDNAADDETSRKRHRGSQDSSEVGRGGHDAQVEDGFRVDDDEPLEVGRAAPTPLPGEYSQDISGTMPWNTLAEQRSSSLALRTGFSYPKNSAASTPLPAARQYGRMGRRMANISPLVGRDRRSHTLGSDLLSVAGSDDGMGMAFGSPEDNDNDFQLPLPGPVGVDVGAGRECQDVSDQDSANFFVFVQDFIQNQQRGARSSSTAMVLSFETLLPPSSTPRVVAACGFLNMLTLATKGLIAVSQEEAFVKISMHLAAASA